MAKDTLYNNSAQDEMQAIYDLLREDRILRYRERQGNPSNLPYEAIRHQNYVDSLQMEREKRMAEEIEAQERAKRRLQEETRLREEERIRKMKSSWHFKSQKFFGGKEGDILKQMENEDDSDYRPLLPYEPLK